MPRPNVDSIVLKLSKKKNRYNPINEEHFYKLVRDSFKYKRKTLKNNLFDYDFDIVLKLLEKSYLPSNIRAEQIDTSMFIEISNQLYLEQ